jgi:hypothetical protein
MEAPQTIRPTISVEEFREKRYILKVIKACVHYAQSKLGGYPNDWQIQGYPPQNPTVWRITGTVEYVPQGPPPVIVPTPVNARSE